MKNSVKTVAITAALAVMIPFSAYAATTNDSSASGKAGTKTEAADKTFKGEGRGGFGRGSAGGFVGDEALALLKLDREAFNKKIEAGTTLAEIAEEQGVSRDNLKSALTADFEKKLEEQKKQFGENLDKLIDSELPAGKHGDGGKGGGFLGAAKDLSAAATVFGLTEEELRAQLKDGKSLADLAKEKGIDAQKAVDALTTAIENRIADEVSAGKLTQDQANGQLEKIGEMVQKIVNGEAPGNGRHRGGDQRPAAKADGNDATQAE